MTITPDTLTRLAPMTEKQLQEAVIELAAWLGWRTFHPWSSVHSAAGWPDLAMVGHRRFIVAELKTERGRLTDAQKYWIDELIMAGVEAHIWRPQQWHDGTIEAILRR